MTAKVLLMMTVVEQAVTLEKWGNLVNDDGTPKDGADLVALEEFDEFAFDFLDNVVMPFPPNSQFEKWTDLMLGMAETIDEAKVAVRRVALLNLNRVLDARPFASWAEGLPD